MPLSRAQFKVKADCLMRKVESTSFKDELSLLLVEAARSTLKVFAPHSGDSGSSTDSTSTEMPDQVEVAEDIRSMFPPASEVFTDHLFRIPTFPAMILYDFADLFAVTGLPPDFVDGLDFTPEKKRDKRLLLLLWLCFCLECDIATNQNVL